MLSEYSSHNQDLISVRYIDGLVDYGNGFLNNDLEISIMEISIIKID